MGCVWPSSLLTSEYHLFPELKNHLGDRQFPNDEDLKNKVDCWVRNLAVEWCDTGLKKLLPRYKKFIEKEGDYLLQLCLKMKALLHWLKEHIIGIIRSLLFLISIWIILVHEAQQHGDAPSYIADVISILPEGKEWAIVATGDWMWAVVASTFFLQLIVVLVSTLRNAPYSIALDTICCLLWIGQQIILSACPTVDHQCELMLRNSTWSLTLDFRGFMEILCYVTLFCETIAMATAGIPSTKAKCTCGQVRRRDQPRVSTSISGNECDLKKGNPFSTKARMKNSFMGTSGNKLETLKAMPFEDEDELGIGSLSLGPAEHNVKEQTVQTPCRKPVIHPARLNIKNIVQSSWVAGGYWQVPSTNWFPMAYHHYQVPFHNTFSYPHSRSSSQSSGFFTSGSASSSVCGDHPESVFMASDSPFRKHPYYANIFPSNLSSFSYYPKNPGFSSPCW
ncbi:hypothetical protein J437_LFUL002853 [Ladona fulva]|uniref:Uncharacterized protein n=1 Tax=Ladona fulva TaxID=123851 RepID=A0A8K0NYV4_LADFU|nr:hypothetical protein J437_LFUL002853 [Ladona fulva]